MQRFNIISIIWCIVFIFSDVAYGMEISLDSPRSKKLLKRIYQLKNNPSKSIQYKAILENLESRFCLFDHTEKDAIHLKVIDYTLEIINDKNIYTLIQTIDEQTSSLKNRIIILTDLCNLPNPTFFNEKESKYWWGNKRILESEHEIKTKQYNCEKLTDKLNRKFNNNRKISLKEWQNYQTALYDYKKVTSDHDEKAIINDLIDETKKHIKLEATKINLAGMVVNIRQSKNADIDELIEYKKKLEQYLHMLPEKERKESSYTEVMNCLSQRIGLLMEIDMHLNMDYGFFAIKDLKIISKKLQDLQDQLNKPQSERYKQLDIKIQNIEGIVKNEAI